MKEPLGLQDALALPNHGEKVFAVAAILKDLIVYREPQLFQGKDRLKCRATLPDFQVINPRRIDDYCGTYVEVTDSDLQLTKKKKHRQAAIMRQQEGVRYVQLGGSAVEAIEASIESFLTS